MNIKEYFNKNKKFIVSGITAACLVVTSGFAGYGFSHTTYDVESTNALAATSSDALVEELTKDINVSRKEIYKDETVYAFSDADGKINNIVVNEWLKNPDKKDVLKDKTNLKDIENIKGDETFSISGEDITWQANGNDIYYQGTISKDLPVDVKISYYLNGDKKTAAEMAGVTGNVTIRFDYDNKTTVKKEINGKKENVKVPFIAISGMILNENFKNVKVSNGKTLPQGANSIVIGYGVPGIKDSLKVTESDFTENIEIPEYFEVNADVTDFALDMTITVLASGAEFKFDGEMDLSDIDAMVSKIENAGDELVSGSGELSKGTSTLAGKMGEFDAGMGSLKQGIDALKEGSGSLASGVDTLDKSAQSISEGVNALDKGLKTPLTDKEKKEYYNKASAEASKKASEAVNAQFDENSDTYKAICAQGAKAFSDSMTSEATVGAIYQGLYANLHDSLYSSSIASYYPTYLAAYQAQGVDLPYDQYVTSFAQLNPDAHAKVEAGIADNLNKLAAGIASGIAEQGAQTTGASVAQACKQSAETAASAAAGEAAGTALITGIDTTKSQIAGQIEAVGESGYSLVSGAQALAQGTKTLNDKVPTLTNGINSLSSGANQLANGSNQLAAGTKQLADGANKLNLGIKQFDAEAIEKIVKAYNGDFKSFAQRIKAVIEAATEYETFTIIDDNDDGITKFIIKTDSIG